MEKAFSYVKNIVFNVSMVYLSENTEEGLDELYAKFYRATKDNRLRIAAVTSTQTVVTVDDHLVS